MWLDIQGSPLYSHPTAMLWRNCLSINSQFCEAVVAAGYLSWEQMLHAASRYCLGASKNRGVIFWQMDHEGRVHDGKVMYYRPDCHRDKSKDSRPTWVSALLRRRERFPSAPHETSHCFFGLHLLTQKDIFSPAEMKETKERALWALNAEHSCISAISFISAGQNNPIGIVEAEKTAFILSEVYPQYVWLASGGLGEVQPDKFRPLRGRKVVLFPDTDPDGTAFRRWYQAAEVVMAEPFWEGSPPIRVSPFLELRASNAQKAQKIDLVDYLFEESATIRGEKCL